MSRKQPVVRVRHVVTRWQNRRRASGSTVEGPESPAPVSPLPLRVLVHTVMYPVMSETYIGEDIETLRLAGADVTVTTVLEAISWAEAVQAPRRDVDVAIDETEPDVVLMHWATHAENELALMERHAQPFAARVHSFDADWDRVQRLLSHPLCVAVFAHPHQLEGLPPGVQPLTPTIGPWNVIPDSPADRRLVLSASAALPKKNFPLLMEVLADLPEFERMVVVATTNGFEDVPGTVTKLAEEADPSIVVGVDVPHSEVLDAMARASVLLYTLTPGARMGYPMSIVEAMLCGTIPITPDREEARAIVGPGLRTFHEATDIVRHVREIAAGGPAVEAERRELVHRAQRHRDPAELVRLHDALRDSLAEWRAGQVARSSGPPR